MTPEILSHLAAKVQAELRVTMNALTDNIATGGCTTFEEYTNMVGQIRGLALAESILIDSTQEYMSAVFGELPAK